MFKVMSAEIKKMVSKSGIYVLAVLLALVLVMGIFIYNPEETETTSISLTGSTFLEKYTYFYGSNNSGIYYSINSEITSAVNDVKSYQVDGVSYKEYINGLFDTFNTKLSDYRTLIQGGASDSSLNSSKSDVVSALTTFYNAVKTGTDYAQKTSYPVLTTSDNYTQFGKLYDKIYDLFTNSTASHSLIYEEYVNSYEADFEATIDNFIYPTLSDSLVKDYTQRATDSNLTKLDTLYNRLSAIEKEILEYYTKAQSDDTFNNNNADLMDELANDYQNNVTAFVNLVNYELLANAFASVSTATQLKLLYLTDYNEYDTNSYLIKYTYLFENNKTDADYANPLAIGTISNSETNAYDYAYFVLSLFSFIIIVYAVMQACHAIAGELKEGTMRYLAIRPVNRSSILFGKLLSIIFMSAILIIFCGVLAVLIGGGVYGYSTLNILTIFNGSTVLIMHPVWMIVIFMVSLLLQVIVYSSIALLLSCLMKSDLLAVTIVMVLYLFNIILPIFVTSPTSWLAYYPFSHISLFSLFGSSLYTDTGSFFNLLLGAKVYTNTSLVLTLVVVLVIVLVTNIISMLAIKKKEL